MRGFTSFQSSSQSSCTRSRICAVLPRNSLNRTVTKLCAVRGVMSGIVNFSRAEDVRAAEECSIVVGQVTKEQGAAAFVQAHPTFLHHQHHHHHIHVQQWTARLFFIASFVMPCNAPKNNVHCAGNGRGPQQRAVLPKSRCVHNVSMRYCVHQFCVPVHSRGSMCCVMHILCIQYHIPFSPLQTCECPPGAHSHAK